MLADMFCKLHKHRIKRRRVWHDGVDFRTRCVRCSALLLRDYTGWREFDLLRDGGVPRRTHPRHGHHTNPHPE